MQLLVPLSSDQINSFEKESNLTFPSSYKKFLRDYNGVFLFGGSPDAIYVLDNNEIVMKLKQKSGKLISKWDTFEGWLFSEITTLNMERKYSV